MTAPMRTPAASGASLEAYRCVRSAMPALARGLSPEDLAAQSMTDCSPGKWHLAHTSWFFEAMILADEPGYEPVDSPLPRPCSQLLRSPGPGGWRVASAD